MTNTTDPFAPATGRASSLAPEADRRARPRLAVAYDINSTSPMGLAALLSDLCEIVWIVDAGDGSLGSIPRLLARLGTVFDSRGLRTEEIAERLHEDGIDGAIAFSDSQLLTATAIAASLGLDGNPPEVIGRLNDKRLQREALSAAGIPVPASCRLPVGTGSNLAVELAASLTFPVVVKPCSGDSSRQVHLVHDLAGLGSLFEPATGTDRLPTEEFIVEEYLHERPRLDREAAFGDYVSVEAIVQGGVPVPVAVTGKFGLADPFRETGNFMPHLLDEDDAAAVLELSVDAAVALGVRSGALHTEIKLTPDGPRIIEVNGRVGGGCIDALYQRRSGQSLTALAARVALGEQVDLVPESAQRWSGPFVYEYFVQPPTSARSVRAVRGNDHLVGTAGARSVAVNRSPGDRLDWRAGSQGYVLRIGGDAPDRAALAAVPGDLLEAADVCYEVA